MRFVSTGLRLAAIVVALAAAPALAASSPSASSSDADPLAAPASTVPEALQGMVGDFILEQEDQDLPHCALTFTDQEAIGGWALQVPQACPSPFPSADSFVAWNIDPSDNSVILLNAERKVTMRLFEDEDGLYDTDPKVTPRFYLLAPYDDDGSGGEADSD